MSVSGTYKVEHGIKDAIMYTFGALASGYAPYLRSLVTHPTRPGNVVVAFQTFLQVFDSLYLLSADTKGLDKELVNRIGEWLDIQHNANEENIRTGLRLFSEYKKELFKMNVLKTS